MMALYYFCQIVYVNVMEMVYCTLFIFILLLYIHTNTIYILNEYVLVNIMFSFAQTLLQIDRKAREVFCSK